MSNLIFIVDDSSSFLNDEVQRIYHEWGYESSGVRRVERWDSKLTAIKADLFGQKTIVNLSLEDKSDLKAFADLVKENKKHHLFDNEWWGNGVIITATTVVGAKAIEKLVADSGGSMIKKGKPEDQLRKLLDRVNLNPTTREVIESYVGREYSMLVAPVREIETYSPEKQRALTADEVIVMLPTVPGNIPPWEFADVMMSGNGAQALKVLERIILHDHPLVPLVFIKRKTDLLYRLKLLSMQGIWDSKQQSAILGEKNSPNVWNTAKIAKSLSLETIESITMETVNLEVNMKGWSRINPKELLKNHVVIVANAIRTNTPIKRSDY